MKCKAYAKLNLSLNVFPKQGEFHPIDSVALSVDIFDEVEVTSRNDAEVNVFCSGVPQDRNTAYKAACEFARRFGTLGCDIEIHKHIPIGAGMGGSSADAAAVVRCLCKLRNVDVESGEIHSLCASVGSDVNFLLRGGLARMTGKGDDLQLGKLASPLFFAVTVASTPLSAKEVYAGFDKVGSDAFCDNDRLFLLLQNGENEKAISLFSNGLTKSALTLADSVENYLNFCRKQGFSCVMTGSGSAFFIACENAEKARGISELLNKNGFTTFVCRAINRN